MSDDKKSNFERPGVYQIKVEGELDPKWSGSLGGMQIKIHREADKTCSIITGEISDQAALNGILNGLYDLHFTVISVMCLDASV